MRTHTLTTSQTTLNQTMSVYSVHASSMMNTQAQKVESSDTGTGTERPLAGRPASQEEEHSAQKIRCDIWGDL